MELTEQQLKQIKYYLIGTITSDNKREVNKTLRSIDKNIKNYYKNINKSIDKNIN
jgi:hypothetical protein